MRFMCDHPTKENRNSNVLTDIIFDAPLKDVSNFFLFSFCSSSHRVGTGCRDWLTGQP